ncbi:hypothetical protein AB0368_07145 [Actinoplanes sp. NPDC051475]|uniref:hypothetical protein n=1 Tax=Actinoplanes sp. NPDC051475 TaxID=3157225 RepID=UPI00344CE609
MSKRGFVAVQESFFDETGKAFQFLTSEFGMNGPELRTVLLPAVAFGGRGIRYVIKLDVSGMSLVTQAEVELEASRLIAKLPELVQAARIGARNHVTSKATTLSGLKHTLKLHARYVRQLQPLMEPDHVLALMRAANAREWD